MQAWWTCSPEPTEDGGLRVHTRLLAEGARAYFPVLEEAGVEQRFTLDDVA